LCFIETKGETRSIDGVQAARDDVEKWMASTMNGDIIRQQLNKLVNGEESGGPVLDVFIDQLSQTS